MNPYGMTLRDQRNCEKGCCAGRYVKLSGHRNPGIKARKKTARQKSRNLINGLVAFG